MIGGLIGAAGQMAGAIGGMIDSSKANRKMQKELDQQKQDNEDWYNRKAAEDYTSRADVQATFNKQKEMLQESQKNARATNAVAGGTDASEALAKQQAGLKNETLKAGGTLMEKVTVIIEGAEHNHSAYLKGINGIVTTGDTVEKIKRNIREAVDLYLEVAREDGGYIPEPLRGDFEFEMDTSTLLNYYDGIFGKPALEKITGINQKQLWQYAMGLRSPRPSTRERINRGLHNLGQELLMLHI